MARGDQVTGPCKAYSRVRKPVRAITAWAPTASPEREVATVPEPLPRTRPCTLSALRTPSKDKPGGYYHAVLFTSRTDLPM